MKNKSISISIVLWVLLGLGVIFYMISNFTSMEVNMFKNSSNKFETVLDISADASKTENLKISIPAGDVSIYHSNDNSIRLVQKGQNIPENLILDITQHGSTLEIKAPDTLFRLNFVNHIFKNIVNHVEIYIPKDYSGKLDIYAASGSMDVHDDFSVSSFYANLSAGKLTLAGITADTVNIKLSAGSFTGESKISAKKAEISSSAGKLSLETLEADDFDLYSSAGSINVSTLIGSGKVSSSAGKITLENVTINEKLKVTSSAGSVRIELAKNTDIEYNIKSSAGRVNTFFGNTDSKNMSGTYGNAPYKKLEISSSAGSVTITEA